MTEKPSLLIVSSSNTKPKSLIKLLTKQPHLTEDSTDSNLISHPWTLDTKYYTAEIDVIGINEQYERTEQFNGNVEALIIHMDSNKDSGLEDLSAWGNLETDCDPDIKLLLANYCTHETKVTRHQATEWCLKRGFELIELYPTADGNESGQEDDLIVEKIGIERVIEALQAHTWSNLVMKSKKKYLEEEKKNSDQDSQEDTLKLAEICEEILTNDGGGGGDDFSELFSQLSMMKDSIQSLPMSQRKQCAEQMVTAFWKAIGGDEEEIADI